MAQQPRASIVGLSKLMACVSACGFILLPLCVIYVFLDPDHSRWMMFDVNHLDSLLTAAVPLDYRLAALAFALAPTAFTMWALWSLRRLFSLYARGSVFSQDALTALNHVAIALFAGVVVGFAVHAPISLLLSWSRGAHHREISLDFGSSDVASLFIACTVLVIARVMGEAQRMADENAKFI